MKSNSAFSNQHSNLEPRTSNLFNESGIALVLVLWFFIFLFVVAINFASSVREEGMSAHRYAEETEGYYLALAGFEEALYHLIKKPDVPQEEKDEGDSREGSLLQPQDNMGIVDGEWREGILRKGLYRVRLVGEGGKVNINRADEASLKSIFTNLGIEERRTAVLVDSILDWRDNDDLHRINGAENDYYLSLSPPYTAKDGPFDTVEDLLWVRGVTHELFYGQIETGEAAGMGGEGENSLRRVGLREIFSVDSPSDRVNLRTASPEVIHALIGLPLEEACAFVEQRKELSEKTLVDVLELIGIAAGDAVLRRFVFSQPSVISIESAAQRADSVAQRQVKGVVRVLKGSRGFKLVRWVDRVMVKSKESCPSNQAGL